MNGRLIEKSFRSMMIMMIFAGIVAMCGSVIDGIVIGNVLGADEMASFGFASPVFMIIAAVAGVFANGGKAQCSVSIGEGDYDEARKNFTLAVILSVVSGLVIMICCLTAAEPIAMLLGANDKYVDSTADYIRGIAIGTLPIMLMQVITGYLGLDGAESLGFVGAIVMSIINISFDLMVGFVWHGGLFEMGLATSFSYLAAIIAQLLYFKRKDKLFYPVKIKFSASKITSMVNTGFPSAISRISFSVSLILLNYMLADCVGEIGVTALSIQTTLSNFISAIFMGITSTISIFSGMYYGEKNKTSLRMAFRIACKYGIIISVAIAAILLAFAEQIAAIILNADEAILSLAANSLRFYAISLPGEILSLILMYHYLSTEKIVYSHTVCILHNFVLLVLPAFLLEMAIGINGIWLGWFMSGILLIPIMLPILWKYRSGKIGDLWMAISKNFEPESKRIFEVSVSDDTNELMKAIEEIRNFCVNSGVEKNNIFRICLSIEEMAGNIINHAFKSKGGHFIDLRLIVNEDKSGCISIRDNGIKFNPLAYQNNQNQYGIRLIRGISTGIDYHYTTSMNNLNIYISS